MNVNHKTTQRKLIVALLGLTLGNWGLGSCSALHQGPQEFNAGGLGMSNVNVFSAGLSSLPSPSLSSGISAWEIYGKSPADFGDATEIIFPEDAAIVLNVQQFGAVGDGSTDDTRAIQNAIYAAHQNAQALYFPNGVYRITRELRFQQRAGRPLRAGIHMYGQSRDGVVLKLDDNLRGFSNPGRPERAVIRTVNAEDDVTFREISADYFNRQIVNFTIDTGNNPGAVGIKFYSNNTGILKNIRVIGEGAIGVDVESVTLNGPHLLQNLEIDGFDIGVQASGSNSTTISNLIVRNAESYGLHHTSGVLQVEGLTVENAAVAVFAAPGQKFGRTTLTLLNGRFLAGDASQPAIINGDILFARHIETEGYAKAIESQLDSAVDVNSTFVDEYSSHGVSKEFIANVDRSLNLPIRYAPIVYDPNPQNWVNVQTYGAMPDDNIDDTQAIQAAVDAAAAAGQTTLYFPGNPSAEPNWYRLDGDISIYGSIRHIIGFAPSRILGTGSFRVIDDAAAPDTVQFQGFNFTKIGYENASSRTMVIQNSTGAVQATGAGDIYLSSVAGKLSIDNPDAMVWARQLNTESPREVNVLNNGGALWLLGHKTERGEIKLQTLNGGTTEVLGAYIYSLGKGSFETLYEVIDSEASFAGIRERTSTTKFSTFILENRDGRTQTFDEYELPAGNEFNRGFSLYSGSSIVFESNSN